MSDDDVKLLVTTLSAAVAAGQRVSVPAERVLELHSMLLVARMERDEVERAARAAEREALYKRRGTLLFNPYSGAPRHPSDIQSDPHGILLVDPERPLDGYTIEVQA